MPAKIMLHELPNDRVTFGVTRMGGYRVSVVEIVGPVAFEQSMVRARFADGTVRRVFREHLREMPAGE